MLSAEVWIELLNLSTSRREKWRPGPISRVSSKFPTHIHQWGFLAAIKAILITKDAKNLVLGLKDGCISVVDAKRRTTVNIIVGIHQSKDILFAINLCGYNQ